MNNHCMHSLRHIGLGIAIICLFVLGSSGAVAQQPEPYWAPVHPSLLSAAVRSTEPVSFLVILDEQPSPETFLAQRALQVAQREQRGEALYRYLTAFARESQAPLRAWLDAQGVAYRPFYIVNAIEVQGDVTLITQLRQRSEVARLAANPLVQIEMLPSPIEATTEIDSSATSAPATPYGILYTGAPEVWAMGYRGTGIVVGSQDTGVQWDHEALKVKYRGWDPLTETASHAYNWFDAWGKANRTNCDADPQVPCDDDGHGTHTVGTILGSEGNPVPDFIVGMAPDAQWIGCRNMKGGAGTPASYTACFEFFLAPYPQGGDPSTDGDPSLAPDLINNSWYCPPSEGCDYESLRQVVETVRAAGQMIVVSAGNNGNNTASGCETIKYPISAYPEVFSVGAHDSSGVITGFSSRGPVTVDGSGRLKPELTAPGASIQSAKLYGGYKTLSGTSMAAPHVAGAVALLWSAVGELKGQLTETEQVLIKSATPVSASQCTQNATPQVPNPVYGYGRLNVAKAVEMALNPALLSVVVTDSSGVQSIGADVTLTDSLTGYTYQAYTAASGAASSVRLYPGDYVLNFAWQDQTRQEALNLVAGHAFVRTFELEPSVTVTMTINWAITAENPMSPIYIPYLQAQ